MVKNPPANAGDSGLTPRSGRFPGEGKGNPLQYSCLENPMHGGAWQATVHGVTKRVKYDLATKQQQQKQLTYYTYTSCILLLECKFLQDQKICFLHCNITSKCPAGIC